MPKISDEFCRKRFYSSFAKMTRPQQRGVLEAFETIMDMTNADSAAQSNGDALLLEAEEVTNAQ